MQQRSDSRFYVPAVSDSGLAWAQRLVWVVCVGVYLTVFIGGVQAGGGELTTVGRAAGFSLLAAVLGKVALNLLGAASVPVDPGPMAVEEGPLDSLLNLNMSANVPQHQDEPIAAVAGER